MNQTIQVSKKGIKISYLRFLSDTTPGYICLFLFGIVFYNKLPLPFVGTSWINIIPFLGTEVKVIFLVILFLLATPIGLYLNALSWFLFGSPVIYFIPFWHKHNCILNIFFVAASRRSMCAEDVDNFIKATSIPSESLKNFYEKSQFFEQLITIYFPSANQQLEPIRGLKRLSRTLSLLCFAVSIYVITIGAPMKAVYSFGIGLFFLLFCSLTEYYQCLFVNFIVFVCCSRHGTKAITFQEAINFISGESAKHYAHQGSSVGAKEPH